MKTLVRGGRVITAAVDASIDLVCVDGRITRWAEPGSVSGRDFDVLLDAAGKVVLPGLIDPHVHSRDPGQTDKESFEASTRAAAMSGVTTLFEMPNAVPPVVDVASFGDRVTYLTERANVDFGLWGMGVVEPGGGLRGLATAGAMAIKVFWGFAFDKQAERLVYSFPPGADERYQQPLSAAGLLELLEVAADADLLVGVHCEDRSIIELAQARHGRYDDYDGLNRCRPVIAEALAVSMLVELALATKARVHVLHLSSKQGLDVVASARARGVRITAETCPHYLCMESADFAVRGAAMKIYPPIRTEVDQQALWDGVRTGVVTSLGSDHAPHGETERVGPLHEQPAGSRGIHATVPVMLDAVNRGRLSLQRLTAILSEDTARLFRCHPRKGSLLPGADADVTIVDMSAPWELTGPGGKHYPHTDPWHGRRGEGRAVASLLRGRPLMIEGDLVSEGLGAFVSGPQAEAKLGDEAIGPRS